MFIKNVCVNQCLLILFFGVIHCNVQIGPDPWDIEASDNLNRVENEIDIPHDLRAESQKKINGRNGAGAGAGEWFYKRMLAIILKAGQVKKNEDGTVDISLQMKFNKERWDLLEEYTAISTTLGEDKIRRSLGYIEEAIYKPTIIEKVTFAWTEHVQIYLVEYKEQITWSFGILASLAAGIWLWKHMSHTHIYIVIFLSLYLYEVFTSYKEAEKADLQRFLSAVNNCKWYIWTSHCDVSPPDPLIFIKYMNPLKIGIRMFSSIITEPMLCINEAVKTLIQGITDSLWFPFDKIVYGILILKFNILFILFLIMIVFNYILNIPFNFSYFGILNIGLKQRNRAFHSGGSGPSVNGSGDRISGDTLNKLLDVCSRALSTAESTQNNQNGNTMLRLSNFTTTPRLRRSSSTGRLPNNRKESPPLEIENSRKINPHYNKNNKKNKVNGGGDWL